MIRRLAPWLALCGSPLLFTGCNTTGAGFAPANAANAEFARPFSPMEESVAATAIREWHQTRARDGLAYELDRYDRRIRRDLRHQLRDICPALPPNLDREDPTIYTVAIDQARLPQGNYAYAVIRVSNRFDTEEHAYVYERRDERWILLDHYLIAEELMSAALIDFSWKSYCRERGIPLPEAPN